MRNPYYLLESKELDVAYLPGVQATVHMASEDFSTGLPSLRPAAKPAAPKGRNYQFASMFGDVQPWGDDNNFPRKILDLYSKDPIIPETFNKKVAMINMSDVIPLRVLGYNDDQSEIVEYVDDVEINTFLNNVSNRRYLQETTTDMVWFFNAFPELIMSRDRSKILYISHQEAANCRYEKRDSQAEVQYVHLNANWPQVQANDPLTVKRRCLNPYRYDRIDWARNLPQGSFIYPINIPTPGCEFYQLATHDSIRTSGWLDIHLLVPRFKKAMMQNEMTIKYHIKVDPRYWAVLYGKENWDKWSIEVRKTKKREWLKEMNKSLTDVENAGVSILTEKNWNSVSGKYEEYVEITAVTENMREGKYILDGLEAAANLFYAMGIDPTIVGFAGGEKMGAKSGGSDKREAWLIMTAMLKPFRDPILEPYYFAAEFNGWMAKYPGLKFRHRDVILTTLDTGKGTKKVLS
jgi:hypothetical protein